MLRSANDIRGYSIEATDGLIGSVQDFLFDDENWIIRYMVVDTAKWLPGRRVLIAHSALGQPNWQYKMFPVFLNKKQIKTSPDIDTDKPVSRQQEIKLHAYYAWLPYWSGIGGMYPNPTEIISEQHAEKSDSSATSDSHLRSIKEVSGYHILATDGEIGHVEDFIVDDESWIIRYTVIDTRNWLPGKKVLLSPGWITNINWGKKKVSVDLSRENIKNSPEYDPSMAVNREYEERLYDFYGRPKYWS